MLTKKHVYGSLLVALSISLTACGGSSGGGSSEGGSAGGDTVTLKIGLPGSYDVTRKEIIDGFQEAHPNIKLQIEESPWGEFKQKITPQIAANNAPDLWFVENADVLGYGARGISEDLAPYIKRDLQADDYIDALFAAQDEDGKVWGVPHGLNVTSLLYNKELFDEAGVPYPTEEWTYEDMIAAAEQISQETDAFGIALDYSIANGWYPWSKIYGGGILDEAKTSAIVTDPKTIQGLETWIGLMEDGIAPKDSEMRAGGGGMQMFGTGQTAMIFLQYSTLTDINNNYPDLDYDAALMPVGFDGNRVVPYVTNTWTIFSKAKPEAKEAAWEFLKYYLSDESQKLLAESGAALPVKESAEDQLDASVKPENRNVFSQGVKEAGMTTDENNTWADWRSAAQPIFTEIYQFAKTPEQGAAEIQKKIQDVLDSN